MTNKSCDFCFFQSLKWIFLGEYTAELRKVYYICGSYRCGFVVVMFG